LHHKKTKNMLSYEDFYNRVWNYYISESDVSYDYRERNQDFIRTVTFSTYREYEKYNTSEIVYAKMLKILFNNLFLFKADNFDNGEIRDFNQE